MRLFHLEDIGPHYATTLKHWRERFFENIDKVKALGYSDQFIRMWEFYLCYSEGDFSSGCWGMPIWSLSNRKTVLTGANLRAANR